jgi:PIN domain
VRKGKVGGTAGHLTLDAGALVAYERKDRSVRDRIRAALREGGQVTVPAGVLAQVWRDRRRQVELGWLLQDKGVTVIDLTEKVAKASGELCGRTSTSDVIDASVVVCAREQPDSTVLTSDPSDIRHLDPLLDVQKV